MKTYRDFGIEIPYGRTSGNIKTFCPQCRDKRHNKTDRSLSVDLSKGVWNCHYCGFKGGLPKNGENKANYRMEYKKPQKMGNATLSEQVVAWFARRGISQTTLTAMRVTEGKEWMPQKNGEENTIQFNYFREGELVNVKYRTLDKCFKLTSGAEMIPYNLDAIKGQKECCICEGEIDALSFVECGITNAISVPNGANANLTYLDDCWDDYFEDKELIYIASDSDTKGVMLREELLRRFGAERCKIVEYGEGCKDANEHLVKYGKDSLLECLEKAVEPKVEGVFTTTDFEDSLDAIYRNGLQKGYTIGYENFDKFCSFETRRLCVLTGIPGCLDENTLIDMADGTRKRISEVRIGEYVQSLTEGYHLAYKPIINKWDSGEKDCYELITRDGHKVVATDEHRFLTFDGWKELKDIKVGEFIGSPVSYNGSERMNEDILKLVAIWIADGNKGKRTYTVTNFTPEVINEIDAIGKRNNLKVHHSKVSTHSLSFLKPITSNVDRYIAVVSHWFRSKGYSKEVAANMAKERCEQRMNAKTSSFDPYKELVNIGVYDMTTYTVRVPDKVMMLDNSQIAIFLNWLFACDGSFYKGSIEYSSVSYGLCEDIQVLLARFGISSYIREKQVKYKDTRRLAYILTVEAYSSVCAFTSMIGITGKQDKMEDYIKNNTPNIYKSDYIPATVKKRLQYGSKFYKKHLGLTMSMNDKRKVRVNRQMVIDCAGLQKDGEQIIAQLDRACRWKEIKSVTYIGKRHTYDIEIADTHNFFANGIVTHNSGKSAFLNFIAERLNMRYGWKFAFFSPESMPISYHGSTLIELLVGKKFSAATMPYNEYVQAKQYLEKNFFFIYPKDDYRLDAILDKAKILVRKKGIKALVIDPYNRLENEQSSKISETQYVSVVLDKLTSFAQQNDIIIFLMAHPTKMPKNLDGKYEVPTLYNISGSANFYNKADFGITVHRDFAGGFTEVHIQKVKFRHLGDKGVATFKYNLNNGRYSEYEDNMPPIWDNSNHLVEKARESLIKAENEAVFEFEHDFDNDLPF